jgi:hypothetical protein
MNWAILIGIALFFIVTAIRDGEGGWNFGQGGSINFSTTIDGQTFGVQAQGDVDVPPDGSGVVGLDDDGFLDIRRSSGGDQQRVRFSSENGSVVRQFFVDGTEQPWGPEADRFVAEVMPIVLRETAIDAPERVDWLLANRGSDGLLDEIALIQSDFAQRIYTTQYAAMTSIAPADFARLMTLAENNMGSDFELRTTLAAVYETQSPSGESYTALLNAGRGLGSDFETRLLLQIVGQSLPNTPEATDAYLGLARSIGSDFELRNALWPLVTSDTLGDELVAQAIELGNAQIGSDFELRVLLGAAAPRVGASDDLARAYTKAAGSLGSDFELRTALMMLAGSADLTPVGWKSLLESARNIGSDFDCAMVLMSVAQKLPQDAEVIEAYRTTLATIGSDFERQRAAAALEGATR